MKCVPCIGALICCFLNPFPLIEHNVNLMIVYVCIYTHVHMYVCVYVYMCIYIFETIIQTTCFQAVFYNQKIHCAAFRI